jgi:integrase/recombinase XerD
MSKIVSPARHRHTAGGADPHPGAFSLYAQGDAVSGGRKYLNQSERQRVLAAMAKLDARSALFALTLAWTGARVSEVLALSPRAFQIERSLIAIVTLKRRRWCVREVPIPPELMRALAQEFLLSEAHQDCERDRLRLWPMCRVTAWRIIKRVMDAAGVSGRPACPRGLRHASGVGTLQAGVPITLVQRWLGHARLSTTAIYAEVAGPEELAFAAKYWGSRDN